MKKLTGFMLSVLFVLSLSPCAFAAVKLEKPTAGQVIFMDADDRVDYTAAFPLSALVGAFRDGKDLCLVLPAAKLTLNDFFNSYDDWRSICFSDGGKLGGADFDVQGNYTGQFHKASVMEKQGQQARLDALSENLMPSVIQVILSASGTEVMLDNSVVYSNLRTSSLDIVALMCPQERTDWNVIYEQRFDILLGNDNSLTPLRSYTEFTDGTKALVVNPQTVYTNACFSMQPMSPGRAAVSFQNGHDELLLSLEILCYEDEAGVIHMSFPCPECGKQLEHDVHYLSCGHFSCTVGSDSTGHEIAQCALAGHCVSEGEHEKCSNCLGYTCDGQVHGPGYCQHVHNWVATTLVSSRCIGCGYVYTR